ncbi:MAG TPA: DNA replication and repair protein RecF [Parachlamydiaceae bacterium]|nr:DNA replication and repair protein RecF [Parachlamydiaceae bacterium]
MELTSLYLKNFRLYKERMVLFAPKTNLIFGANARGKTTILEAIYYFITGKSFRTEKPQELISSGENYFYLEISFKKHSVSQSLKVFFDGKERKILYNNTKLSSAVHLFGILQGVLLTPDDVSLIKGEPLLRREFFDAAIAQADPLYIHYLTRYKRALRQRNCLLKAKALNSIESFEHEMAASASYIALQRREFLKNLEFLNNPMHLKLSGEEEAVSLRYKPSGHTAHELDCLKKTYLDLFKKNRLKEVDLGVTYAGPHKDDLLFFLNEKEVRHFASEGQQRSLISTLRFSQWMQLKNRSQGLPLMLIDDLGISLDEGRKKRQLEFLNNFSQVFLTMTEPAKIHDDENLIEIS